MAFFASAIDTLKILVIALGAGLGAWGVINLLEDIHKSAFPLLAQLTFLITERFAHEMNICSFMQVWITFICTHG